MENTQTYVDSDLAVMEMEKTQDRIFCANCINCKLVKRVINSGGQYQLRVKCVAGKWRKKLGEEKVYKYFTVARRSPTNCDAYIQMGNAKEFMRELKKSLPIKDEIYTEAGSED